ncbi:MAG: hypothetical protein FJ255_01475 [Phycisphaerae bacterium]|nr:hypothetical protein [Phycisphaerae bacterium]
MRRRVVITGIGTATAYGMGKDALWEGLLAGRSTIARLTAFDPSGFRSRFGSEAKEFSAKDFVPKTYRKAVKVMARDTELAVAAARLAVEDAGLVTRGTLPESGGATTYPGPRMACQIGAGLIAAETDELSMALAGSVREGEAGVGGVSMRAWGDGPEGESGMNSLPPLWLLKYLPNMLACHVTIIHGTEGPSNTITCSEASGLLSLGESTRVIERDMADLAFSGSAESKVNHMGLMRLDLAGWLAPTPDDGPASVRPYDPGATGTLVGEAGGILILEELGCAHKRGVGPYCEVAGFGAAQTVGSGPADRAWVDRSGDGLAQAIAAALRDAGTTPDRIDLIVPNGCGVPDLDAAEADALRTVFGERLARIPLLCLPTVLGQSMAGQGAVMTAAAALAIRHQTLPARVHAGTPAPGLLAGAAPSAPAPIREALVCTASLGGQNAAVVLRALP